MDKPVAIGPSIATFAEGNAVIAESPSSCPRNFLVRKSKIRFPVDPLYTAIGELDEHRFIRKLTREQDVQEIVTQKELDIPFSANSKLYGKLDIKVTYGDDFEEIIEKKAHISKGQRLKIIRKGIPKMSHVAQIATYMSAEKMTNGRIVHNYYEFDKDCLSLHTPEGIEFKVNFVGDAIHIDGDEYKYGKRELVRFYQIIDKAVERDTLPQRPVSTDTYRPVCSYCPMREICNEADARGWDKEQFLTKVKGEADRLIEAEAQRTKPAEIWAPALRRKKKND